MIVKRAREDAVRWKLGLSEGSLEGQHSLNQNQMTRW